MDRTSRRPNSYTSPAIIERRRRILSTARRLLATQDIGSIGMAEIAEAAEVSKRTLYNAFKSRDLLLAAAIQQYFVDYEKQIPYSTQAATPGRIAEHLSIVCRRNVEVREYTRTLLTLYFTASASDVRDAIFEIAAHSHRPWIVALKDRSELLPWIDESDLVGDLVRYRYAVGIDWAHERIPDAEFAPTVIVGVLTMVRGAVVPSAIPAIDDVIANWRQ